MSTDRQTDNTIFYKVETYIDRLLVPKIIANNTKICKNRLSGFSRFTKFVFKNRMNNRRRTRLFFKVETCIDRLLVHEMHIIPNFVKIV